MKCKIRRFSISIGIVVLFINSNKYFHIFNIKINILRVYTEDEWDQTREKRIGNWRRFSGKQNMVGTKRSDRHLRPPEIK